MGLILVLDDEHVVGQRSMVVSFGGPTQAGEGVVEANAHVNDVVIVGGDGDAVGFAERVAGLPKFWANETLPEEGVALAEQTAVGGEQVDKHFGRGLGQNVEPPCEFDGGLMEFVGLDGGVLGVGEADLAVAGVDVSLWDSGVLQNGR